MRSWPLVVMLLPGLAAADVNVQARGSATVTGGDVTAAKTRALDDAIRQAVDQAAGAMLSPEERARAADLVKKRILRKARSYVLRYKVASEGEADGVYAITVDATIADGPLGVDVRALVAAPATPEPSTPPRPGRPGLAVLAVTREGDQVWATFGRGSDAGGGGPVAPALERELGARGFALVKTAGLEVPVSSEGEGGVPLAVSQAAEIARKAGAGGALVVGAQIKGGGRIRGTRLAGAEVDVKARLVDAAEGGSSLAEAAARGAGHGESPGAAALSAGRDAATQVGRQIGKRLESHWPAPDGPVAGGTFVHLRGATRAPDVEALERAFLGAAGVKAVILAELARGAVTLLVRGGTAKSLADAAAGSALAGVRVSARVRDGEVDVELAADPLRLPPPITPEATP